MTTPVEAVAKVIIDQFPDIADGFNDEELAREIATAAIEALHGRDSTDIVLLSNTMKQYRNGELGLPIAVDRIYDAILGEKQ